MIEILKKFSALSKSTIQNPSSAFLKDFGSQITTFPALMMLLPLLLTDVAMALLMLLGDWQHLDMSVIGHGAFC